MPLATRAETTVTVWGRPVVTNVPPTVTNVVDIAAGDGFAVALLANGTLAAWGTNRMGITNIPTGLSNVVAVSAAAWHVMALQRDGRISGWGSDGASRITLAPSNCIAISAGPQFNLGLRKDGTVGSWPETSFIPFGGLSNIIGIAAGSTHGLAITSERNVIAWGGNAVGQANVPSGLSNVVSVAAGDQFSAALTADGELVIWGTNNYAPLPQLSKADKFRSISARRQHLLALREDGSVFAWGGNSSGQTNVPPNLGGVVLIAAGDNVSVAVSGDVPPHIRAPLLPRTALLGTTAALEPPVTGASPMFYQWFFNNEPIPGADDRVLRFPKVAFADAGIYTLSVSNHAGVVSSTGISFEVSQVTSWGSAATNAPSGLTNLVAISGGISHVVGLKRDGTIATWGLNAPEVPAGLSNVVAISAGEASSAALTQAGQVITWGKAPPGPEDLENVVAIASGSSHLVALRADGTVEAWGQAGAGVFTPPADLDNVVAVAASFGSSAALRADGRIVTWPTFSSPLLPDNPGEITNAVAIAGAASVSVHHMLALRDDGSLAVWGLPKYRYLPPPLAGIESMTGGGQHDAALLRDGSIAAWGSASGGVTNVPANLPPMSQIASTAGGLTAMVGVGAPHILSPLVDRRIAVGGSTFFRVNATGQYPLRYQWSYDGEPIADATNSLLILRNTAPEDAGSYSVLVANSAGTAEQTATLSVVPAVVIRQPSSVTNLFGSTVLLQTEAQGEDLRYQWQHNGVDLPGQTNSVLRLENVGCADAGLYRAVIANRLGSVQTREAALHLQQVGYWGSDLGSNVSVFVTGLTNVLGISAGDHGSLAIDDSLTLLPIGETNIIAASAARYFTLMLRDNGTVAVYGENPVGPTQPPPDLTNAVAVAAGYYHAMALRNDGTVVAWGDERYGVTNVPSGLRDVVAIAAGHELSLALTADGTVVQWGDDDDNPLLALPEGLTNVIRIACSLTACIALRSDGTVVTWGMFDYPGGPAQAPPDTLTNVVAVAAGASHFLALTAEGRVVAWGWNGYGQTTVPDGLGTVTAIAAGYFHNLVLTDSHPPVLQTPMNLAGGHDDGAFRVTIRSAVNSVFALEYAETLESPRWERLPLVAGNGGDIVLKDPAPNANARFYRVRRW